MKKTLKEFLNDEKAQALVEYTLILCLLSIVSLAAIKMFMTAWRSKFNSLKAMRTGYVGMEP